MTRNTRGLSATAELLVLQYVVKYPCVPPVLRHLQTKSFKGLSV